jgi:hypothetical protein
MPPDLDSRIFWLKWLEIEVCEAEATGLRSFCFDDRSSERR